ncbi:hypothetical protein PG999_006255 [Apiospora kogelbergensis]|uniref:Glycosyl transferase CAP10 domain-containing protein n=1 Tax=Apiospora kogelbergensis TaxID=1337665 RepID=A0AAW0QT62_9PEZI
MGGKRMAVSKKQSARLRNVAVVSLVLLVFYGFLLHSDQDLGSSRPKTTAEFDDSPRDQLRQPCEKASVAAEAVCATTFPGLTKEIDDVVAKGPFTLTKTGDLGPLIARVKDGKLFILQSPRRTDLSEDMLQHRSASLHQVAAALLTSPNPAEVPDTIFALNHRDDPAEATFSYSRPADPSLNHATRGFFPIPHFSFWSWPLPFIGSLPRAASAIRDIEDGKHALAWRDKDPRAVWRGTAHFNNVRAGRMRQELLLTGAGKPWSDIAALQWTDGGANASNALPIEEFCRYRYVVHTEGITYSGRFQFHQLCASVILTPPLAWMQHLTHLVRPVFSYDLPSLALTDDNTPPSSADSPARLLTTTIERTLRPPKTYSNGVHEKLSLALYPAPWVRQAWPRSYLSHDEQGPNMVFVAPDWSDLESVVAWLEAHPRVAEGIARRQRNLFDGRGYFSPAAETCYWRAALRGWSRAAQYNDQPGGEFAALGDGVPWEEFSLKEIHR